jgi:NADPH2:quinone reductase
MPLNLVLLKSCDVRGVAWGAWNERDTDGHRANTNQLLRWCADGKLSVHVHATFPLARTADALKVLADRKAMGKVILTL